MSNTEQCNLDAWMILAMSNVLSGKEVDATSPFVLSQLDNRNTALLEAANKLTGKMLDALIGTPDSELSRLLLKREYLISATMHAIPDMPFDDATCLWSMVLSDVIGQPGGVLQFPSGNIYSQLTTPSDARQLYMQLQRFGNGVFDRK